MGTLWNDIFWILQKSNVLDSAKIFYMLRDLEDRGEAEEEEMRSLEYFLRSRPEFYKRVHPAGRINGGFYLAPNDNLIKHKMFWAIIWRETIIFRYTISINQMESTKT